MSSSYIMANGVLGGGPLVAGWLVMFALLFSLKKKWTLDTLRPGAFLLFIMLLSHLLNGDGIVVILLCVLPLIFSIGLTFCYSYKEVSDAFIKVMTSLCALALVCYVGALFSDFFRGQLLERPDGTMFFNFYYIHITWFESMIPRNTGLFWEPGAFQAYISLALILYLQKEDARFFEFVLFTIATITTFSTTGYIVYALIFIFVLPKSTLYKKNKKWFTTLTVTLGFLLFSFSAFLIGDESSTFGKLSAGKDESHTTYVRYYSVVTPIKAFITNPILGLGYSGLQKFSEHDLQGQVTCTFINYFGMFGVFYGALMARGYYRLAKKLFKYKMLSLIGLGLFFMITFSENMIRMPIFIVLPLLAYQNNLRFWRN